MVFGIALVVVAGVISAFGITQVRHSAPPVPEPWPACGLSLGPSGWAPRKGEWRPPGSCFPPV